MLRRVKSVSLIGVVLVVLVAAGCGGSGKIHFATTKFVLHSGLAFGAFHHFIYTPLKAGDFKHPLQHKGEVVKAGLAAVFAVHELKIAYKDAKASKLLSKLAGSLGALEAKLAALGGGLKLGQLNAGDITSVNSDIASITSQSPVHIKDLPTPSLGG